MLGPEFAIISYFDSVPELLTASIEADVAVLDEEVARDLDLLKRHKPDLAILKISLEDNTGCLYSNTDSTSSAQVLSAIQGLKDRFLVKKSSELA
ncbi:MAG: hypothetical protein HY776_08185 [Actinobacteria bacterium]|nr:hypothetical protein [Actinomycetota bacterium]